MALPKSTMESIRHKALTGEKMMLPTPEKQAIYDSYAAQNKGYDKTNYQTGYGIGNSMDWSGGFNDFNNMQGVGSEIGRMNQVLQNRTNYGLDNSSAQGYLDKLNNIYAPYQQQQTNMDAARNQYTQQSQNYQNQINQAQNQYNTSQAKFDAQRWSNATIADIAAKYGFDYSRDYAKQQAEAEAQALRNANQDAQRRNVSNRDMAHKTIDSNLMNMAEGLDRNYFQQMLQQQQNQVGTGMNAGIAADQDLRLQMNRQAEMGASYRDANLGKMRADEAFNLDDLRLAEAMGLIDQQALAREDSLYNERLQQGLANLMQERSMVNARDNDMYSRMMAEVGRIDGLDQQMWGRSQSEIERAMGQQNFLSQLGMQQTQFDWNKHMDQQGLNQWQQQFDYGMSRDRIGDQQWQQQFDWGKLMDEAGLLGSYNGQRTLPGQQFDWGKVVDQHSMNNADARLALQRQAQAQAASAASSGSGSGNTAQSTAQPTKLAQQFLDEVKNVPQTDADRKFLPITGQPIINNPYADWLDTNMFRLGRYGG